MANAESENRTRKLTAQSLQCLAEGQVPDLDPDSLSGSTICGERCPDGFSSTPSPSKSTRCLDDAYEDATSTEIGGSRVLCARDFGLRPFHPGFVETFLHWASMPQLRECGRPSKLVHDAVRMLHARLPNPEDVCSILAHASIFFSEFIGNQEKKDHVLNDEEAAYILILEMFLAHCHVVDQPIPLSQWHKCFFTGYCRLHVLDQAVLKLMQEREYKLLLPEAQVVCRYLSLQASLANGV